MNQRFRFGRILCAQFFMIPFQLLADAICDVAEVIGFGQPSGIFKIARRWRARFAGVNPFGVMAERFRDEGIGAFEVSEFGFRQQRVFAVIGEQHAFVANKQHAGIPLRDAVVLPDFWLVRALIPRQLHGR